MAMSDIVNFFEHLSKSMGLPPIVLLCTLALFLFIFIFGAFILIKIKAIRSNILVLTKNLDDLIQIIERETESKKSEQPNKKTVGEKFDTKNYILRFLQETNKPVSYMDLVKQLSKNYPEKNHDYGTIIDNLDQLKGEGEITSQLYFGKLYFQINRPGL